MVSEADITVPSCIFANTSDTTFTPLLQRVSPTRLSVQSGPLLGQDSSRQTAMGHWGKQCAHAWLVGDWLLNVLATCQCVSRICSEKCTCCHTEKKCRSNLLSNPVTVYRHRANQSYTDPATPDAWQGSHRLTNLNHLSE